MRDHRSTSSAEFARIGRRPNTLSLILISTCLLFSNTLIAEQRIISLAPHITETLFAVGAGDDIVGVVAYSDYPAAALEIEQLGSADRLNYEQIIALQPTLILGWESGNGLESLERLKQLGFNVYSHNPETLEDVAESLEVIGHLSGRAEQGTQAKTSFLERLEALRADYSGQSPITVFYQIWNEPIMTVNDQHLIADVIRLCGGVSLFGDAAPLVPRISVESVLQRNPDVIIAAGMAGERPEWIDDWNSWPTIDAVNNNRLYHVHPDLMHRHSPRILQGAEQVCVMLEESR